LNESRPVAGELLFRQLQVHDRHLIKDAGNPSSKGIPTLNYHQRAQSNEF